MDASTLPSAFHVMTKPRGAICNLDCKYCYFLSKENLYQNGSFRMDEGLLEAYVRDYIAAQRVPEVNFAWQGGEPTLMGLEFYHQVVAYQKKYQRPGMKIQNSLQTNGLQTDDAWAEFFKRENFLVGVSLDGPQALHDAYRVDKGGNPTHARVLGGIECLKRHGVDFNILCCVHAANARHPLQVYRHLRDEIGAEFIQFIPIVERANDSGFQEGYQVTQRSVTGRQYGEFMIAIFDEWSRRDIGRVFIQLFDVCLGVWLGRRAGLCVFEETCGQGLALEHNGDLYSCDHYVEPAHLLGNIRDENLLELVASDQQLRFGQAKRDSLPEYCRKCEVRFICNGGCPKDRIRKTPDGEPGLNYLCAGYKAFFTHIDAPMKLMAGLIQSGRPPALAMGLLGSTPPPASARPGKPERRARRHR